MEEGVQALQKTRRFKISKKKNEIKKIILLDHNERSCVFLKFITVDSDLEQSFPVFDFQPVFELSSEDCSKKHRSVTYALKIHVLRLPTKQLTVLHLSKTQDQLS